MHADQGQADNGHSPEVLDYACSGCAKSFPSTDVVTKQIRFRKLGSRGNVVYSKNVGNYCSNCLDAERGLVAMSPVLLIAEIIQLKEELDALRGTTVDPALR